VGIAGSFLAEPHTLEHFRSELFEPRLLFRKRRPDWTAAGAKRLDERAEEIASDLMNQPPQSGLSAEQERALDAMAEGFQRKVTRG